MVMITCLESIISSNQLVYAFKNPEYVIFAFGYYDDEFILWGGDQLQKFTWTMYMYCTGVTQIDWHVTCYYYLLPIRSFSSRSLCFPHSLRKVIQMNHMPQFSSVMPWSHSHPLFQMLNYGKFTAKLLRFSWGWKYLHVRKVGGHSWDMFNYTLQSLFGPWKAESTNPLFHFSSQLDNLPYFISIS